MTADRNPVHEDPALVIVRSIDMAQISITFKRRLEPVQQKRADEAIDGDKANDI